MGPVNLLTVKRPPLPAGVRLDENVLAAHPYDGPFYQERSPWAKIDQIEVPMLQIVPLSLLHSRGQLSAYPRFKAPKKLMVVPRSDFYHEHVLYLESTPLNEQILKWFDFWLQGRDTGILDEPEVAVFDSGTGTWRYENEYPMARTEWTERYGGENERLPDDRFRTGE